MSAATATAATSPSRGERLRTAARWLLTLAFVGVGIAHFTNTAEFVQIVPPALPWPEALVYISGIAEILGGLGVAIPATRRWAGVGLIALLLAVFPANIYMAMAEIYVGDMPREPWLLWARLPFQAVFVVWVWWVALKRPPAGP